MLVEYHPDAVAELKAATFKYESRVEGLGQAFLSEYLTTLDQVVERPLTWRLIFGGVRKGSAKGSGFSFCGLMGSFDSSASPFRWGHHGKR